MDIVFIEQLSVITTIGVYDWEQTIEQKLVFDIEIAWDNRKAAASDDVSDCLSYADISERVIARCGGGKICVSGAGGGRGGRPAAGNIPVAMGAHKSQQTWRRGSRGKRRGDY